MAVGTVDQNLSDAEVDALFESVLKCEPFIPETEAERLAGLIGDASGVVRNWRLTALLSGKGGQFYREIADDAEKAKVFAQTIDPLNEFAALLREIADLSERAATRLMVAGCSHEGFAEWVHAES